MNNNARSQNLAVAFQGTITTDTARQILCGVETLISHFDDASARGRGGDFGPLADLMDRCVTEDVSLPSGFRLAIRMMSDKAWKKPIRAVVQTLAKRNGTTTTLVDSRPVPGVWDAEETVQVWHQEESDTYHLPHQVSKRAEEQMLSEKITAARQMLSNIAASAERRILGQDAPRPVTRRSREESENILREDYLHNREIIEFLKHAIKDGSAAAERVAKQHFKHTALKKRLNLSHGVVSESPTYHKLREELQLDKKISRRTAVGFEIGVEKASMSSHIGPEIHELIERINACVETGGMKSEFGVTLCNWMREGESDDVIDEIEKMVSAAEQGKDPLNHYQG